MDNDQPDNNIFDAKGYRFNVGIVLLNAHNQAFWGRRSGQDSWQFPQGGINAGESSEQAMWRELFEETGLGPADVSLLGETRDWLYYRLPRALRRRLAEKLRQQSQARTRRKASAITDTHPAAIRTALENAAATVLIHGHTHRPAVHHLDDGNTVYVLGDWRPYGEILRYADGTFTLADCRANCGRIAVF